METLAGRVGHDRGVKIINFGPSTSLARAMSRNLTEFISTSNEVTDAFIPSNKRNTPTKAAIDSQEPIAIVGMAVNFPGAQNADDLWHLLEQGLNTVQEVCLIVLSSV